MVVRSLYGISTNMLEHSAMSEQKPILILVTNNYPFLANHGEVMFVHPEIPRLRAQWDRIIIVPLNPYGPNLYPDCGCELDLSLAQMVGGGKVRLLINFIRLAGQGKCWNLMREIFFAFYHWGIQGGKWAISWSLYAATARYWMEKTFHFDEPILFYTYWKSAITIGLVECAQSVAGWSVVTRVHRVDLYHDRQDPPYLPFHPYVYSKLDMTFTISQAGSDYLVGQGVPKNKLTLARLGIEDSGFIVPASVDGIIRIVSCSYLAPVKRVNFIAQCICAFAQENPEVQMRWTHLGGGTEYEKIQNLLAVRPANLYAEILGPLSNQAVMDFYKSHACDVFVNLSSSEGLPVSMMEACAIGLPILATDVGGVREIVGKHNGILLPANPSQKEVIDGFKKFHLMTRSEKLQLKSGARAIWEEMYSANTNHTKFSHLLADVYELGQNCNSGLRE